MATETIGKYQLHLIGLQIPETGKWAPYLMIDKFDDATNDFKCVLEKVRVADHNEFDSEAEAENMAREYGNSLLQNESF